MDDITDSLQMNKNTVYETFRRFRERRIAAKEDEHGDGRPKKLSTKELKALKRGLLKGPRNVKSPVWTTKQVQGLIRKKYHGNYVIRHVRRMPVDMGFSLQKPPPRHRKTDEKAQAHFKNYPENPDISKDFACAQTCSEKAFENNLLLPTMFTYVPSYNCG